MMRIFSLRLLLVVLSASTMSMAGGPILVGGPAVGVRPAFGVDAQPFTWDPTKMPIAYRLDPGPMATAPGGGTVIDHATGVQRVQNMLAVWQGVTTANISFSNAGAILPTGSYTGGDLKTVQQFNAVMGSCQAGTQSPIIFDADGSLIGGLGLPPEVIGFDSGCKVDAATGYFVSSAIVLNGEFQDGINSPNSAAPNFELSSDDFDEAITHEMGHFLGLGHSQINLDTLLQATTPCDVDSLAGIPLMFPIEFCQSRKSAGLPVVSQDDVAWISSLYPNASTVTSYGTISGTIWFGDGQTPIQGVNVIARLIDDPSTPVDESRRFAISAVSGYLFTGNPGQPITATISHGEDNTNGSAAGSRNPALIGYYEIPLPPGTYTVEVETVNPGFVGGSGVGPLNPPAVMPGSPEFWDLNESAFDFPLQRDTITVHPGDKITGIDIILDTGYPTGFPRFDQYEDGGELFSDPTLPPVNKNMAEDLSA